MLVWNSSSLRVKWTFLHSSLFTNINEQMKHDWETFVCLSVCPVFHCICFCSIVCLSVCVSVCLSACLSPYLSFRLSIRSLFYQFALNWSDNKMYEIRWFSSRLINSKSWWNYFPLPCLFCQRRSDDSLIDSIINLLKIVSFMSSFSECPAGHRYFVGDVSTTFYFVYFRSLISSICSENSLCF